MEPTRSMRNVRGSFNKYLQSVLPDITFNFQEGEFETAQLMRWVEVTYLSRTADVKQSIISQASIYAKDDRFGVKVEALCDRMLDSVCGDPNAGTMKTLPLRDWNNLPDAPVIGGMVVRPRQVSKPVIDTYGVTTLSVTVEIRMARA